MTIRTIVHSAHQHLQQVTEADHLKRTHVYELFAAAFGFNSYAALKTQAVFVQSPLRLKPLDGQAVAKRYEALGHNPVNSKLLVSTILDLLNANTISVAGIQDIISSLCGPDWSTARNFEWEDDQEDDIWDDLYLGSEDKSNTSDAAHSATSLELWDENGEPNVMMMDCLESAAQGGNALAHYALALIYGGEYLDYPDYDDQPGSTYWFKLAAQEGGLSDADKKWVEAYGGEYYHKLSKSFQHLKEAARLGQQNALLKAAELFENPAFFKQADPEIVADPAEIARIAANLDREEDARHWLTVAARYGDTNAMRELIEEQYQSLQVCWEWFYLAKLCGVDLSTDHYYAIHEDGSLYNDDIGGNAFVGGTGGVNLEPLTAEQDAAAQLAAQKMFSELQAFRVIKR
jgi:hypothetical protein